MEDFVDFVQTTVMAQNQYMVERGAGIMVGRNTAQLMVNFVSRIIWLSLLRFNISISLVLFLIELSNCLI